MLRNLLPGVSVLREHESRTEWTQRPLWPEDSPAIGESHVPTGWIKFFSFGLRSDQFVISYWGGGGGVGLTEAGVDIKAVHLI